MFINWKRLLLAVYRLEEGQQEILARLDRMEMPRTDVGHKVREGADEWLQDGIDNILSYSVGKKSDDAKENEE